MVAVIFAWVRMCDICKTPYGTYKHYDVDLEEKLDVEIWKASVTLQKSYKNLSF